jgi:hypothetical protein
LQRYKIQAQDKVLEENLEPLLVFPKASKGCGDLPTKQRIKQALQNISSTEVKNESHIQAAFDKNFSDLLQVSSLDWEYRSTYKLRVFDSMSPDALLVVKHGSNNALYTVGVMEYENIAADSFSDDHKEKLIIYNEFALSRQNYRPNIVSFLCSSRWALQVHSYRERNERDSIKHKVSAEFKLLSPMATDIFSTYFSMTLQDHEFYTPEIEDFVPVDFLGAGSFSFVYKVHTVAYDQEFYVAKVFRDEHNFEAEKATLDLLRTKNVENVPKIFKTSQAKFGVIVCKVLILDPVADKLEAPGYTDYRSLTLRDIEGAIETLKEIHELKIIHRDIRPPNVLLAPNAILISDFGCSLLHQDGRKV